MLWILERLMIRSAESFETLGSKNLKLKSSTQGRDIFLRMCFIRFEHDRSCILEGAKCFVVSTVSFYCQLLSYYVIRDVSRERRLTV